MAFWRAAAAFLFVLATSGAAFSQDNAVLERRAAALGDEIRCVVCQAESINDSAAPMAADLRLLIREKMAAGASDDEIKNWLRDRYGDFILLRPPVQGNTYILWSAPVLIGIFAIWPLAKLTLRARMRRLRGSSRK